MDAPTRFPYRTRYLRCFALALAGLLIFTSSGAAQIIEPPRPPAPPPIFPVGPGRIQVDQYSLDAVIDGPLAAVTVQQVFHNTGRATVEGAYIFPVPANASPGDLQLTVDGQTLEGRLYPAEEAERIYTEIVRRQRDPALLAYVGRGLYQTRVFPIPPGASRTVTLTYRHMLEQDGGLYRFDAPIPGAGTPDRAPKRFALRVELRNQPGLRTLYSPSHNVSIQREGPDGALVGFETTEPAEMRPFALYFGTDASALGVNLLSYRPAGEDGFFLLLAAPAVDAGAQALVARDVILVLDVSGSMQGEKIEQARAAARYVVDHLNPGDRFNLVRFSTGVDVWQARLQAADADAQKAAHRWIDATRATGSTDINRALLEALSLLREPTDRPAYILFLTDGLPTVGVQEPERILENATANAPQDRAVRLFTFGVGYDVNTDLLDELSRSLGGTSTYVQPGQRIDEAVSDFYTGVSAPVLAQVQLEITGAGGEDVAVYDTYPFPVPDLFAGRQLVWAGRYKTGGPVTVTVAGQVNGEKRSFVYPELSLAEKGGVYDVARVWATRKIGALLTAVRHNGASQEVIDEIVALSMAYGIVTPYTSYLAMEPDMEPQTRVAPRAVQAFAAPAVAQAVQEAAAAEAVGEAAVRASVARAALEEAESVREERGVRAVAGKTFVQQGVVADPEGAAHPFWVDSLYDEGMPLRTVLFGSPAYFRLAADPVTAQWLALSPEMVLVVNGQALRISLTAQSVAAEPDPCAGDR